MRPMWMGCYDELRLSPKLQRLFPKCLSLRSNEISSSSKKILFQTHRLSHYALGYTMEKQNRLEPRLLSEFFSALCFLAA